MSTDKEKDQAFGSGFLLGVVVVVVVVAMAWTFRSTTPEEPTEMTDCEYRVGILLERHTSTHLAVAKLLDKWEHGCETGVLR